jgi:hypothetical protein
MRILPFGDGVVLGDGASGGFRDPLETLLANAGIHSQFIGSRTENSFEMESPFHEGWRGESLSTLREVYLIPALTLNPDIVLLYAGLDDLLSVPDAGIAVARYEKLLKKIGAEKPELRVFCSQLIPAKDYLDEQRVKKFNVGLGALVESLARKGMKVKRVKMHARIKVETLNPAGVPNEAGYKAMAVAWFSLIEDYAMFVPDVDAT